LRVLQAYAAAVGSIGLALVTRFALDSHLGDHLPYVTFFVAVAAVAWYSPSLGPPSLAALLGLLASHWFFVPPRGAPFDMALQHWVGLWTYVMVTGAFIGFGGALQASRRRAEDLNAELERKVIARTAELKASTEELETFSYSVAHDLRAPLRSISGFAQVVLRKAATLDPESRDLLNRIVASGIQMSRLIDGLLNLSRVNRKEVKASTVDLTREALAIADDLKKTQPERRVDFVIAPGMEALGDPDLLKTVLTNLLENAWKFTSKRPSARIEFRMKDGAAGPNRTVFLVRDDGAGFDMAHIDKLFGPFSRLHHPSEFPGSGIGLATVQRIIRRHGGEIWAESAPDQGTTVYFTVGTLRNRPTK
jgi:signal transduction histidine kinase